MKSSASFRYCISAAIIFLCVSLPVHASVIDDAELDYGADIRQTVLMMTWPESDILFMPDDSFGLSSTRARGWARSWLGPFTMNLAVETSGDFASSASNLRSGGGMFSDGQPLEHWDATVNHIDEQTTSLVTRLERLDVRWSAGRYDIDVGRQPVSLGTSHFVGVLDVLAPFAPGDLDGTYKPGIDAIRIRRGIGMAGEVELIAAGADTWEDGALLGRFRTMAGGFDFELVGGQFRRRKFGGIGWEGELWGQSFWGETALFEYRDNDRIFGGSDDAAFSGVAGFEFDLPWDIILGTAGMYQDFGVRDPEDLTVAYRSAPFTEGWLFLASAAYGVVTLHRELHPLVQGDLAGIGNLVDGSSIWQPKITISTGNNTDLALYGWIGIGEQTGMSRYIPVTKSEFGDTPDGGGLYARWFF